MNGLLLAAMIGQCAPGYYCPPAQYVPVQPAVVYERPPRAYVEGPVISTPITPVQPSGQAQYSRILVQVHNDLGGEIHSGSGVILTRSGLVLTCRHIWDQGVGRVTVYRPDGKLFEGRLAAVDDRDDLSAVQIADPGPIPQVRYAVEQPKAAILVGFPRGSLVPIVKPGVQLTASTRYSFVGVDGDSGGPIFAQDNPLILSGVLWGSTGRASYATSYVDVNRFLARRCFSFFGRDRSPNNYRSGNNLRLFSADRRQYFGDAARQALGGVDTVAYAPPQPLQTPNVDYIPLPTPSTPVVYDAPPGPPTQLPAPPKYVPILPSPQLPSPQAPVIDNSLPERRPRMPDLPSKVQPTPMGPSTMMVPASSGRRLRGTLGIDVEIKPFFRDFADEPGPQ